MFGQNRQVTWRELETRLRSCWTPNPSGATAQLSANSYFQPLEDGVGFVLEFAVNHGLRGAFLRLPMACPG
ncbi:MAG: hypothetical protein HC933_16460 [Pleurocapsa sp. SU_196_0]|nr:hypothetical protein [Pleurocapsa sp. SU_196_0]